MPPRLFIENNIAAEESNVLKWDCLKPLYSFQAKTILGEHLLNVGINRDNVSEILQIFMEAHCGQTELTESLKTKAFQAHTPAQKASVLAFLVNELACSKSVVR